jgi:hypothetical protein
MSKHFPLLSLICLFFFTITTACKSDQIDTVGPASLYIETDPQNYPAISNNAKSENFPDTFLGLVKVFVEHGFKDEKGVSGWIRAQGSGSLVVYNDRWFVITAKHIVFPNPDTTSIIMKGEKSNKTIEFKNVIETGSRVVIGNTGIQPSTLWLPTNDNIDIAILEIPKDLQPSLIFRTLDNTNTNYSDNNIQQLILGSDVEVWGYPARQSPQMKKVGISDVAKGYFVLNQALEPGFSGGLALSPIENSQKRIIGMIIRSDDEVSQSTVINWSDILFTLDSVVNRTEYIRLMELNDTVDNDGVAFTYYDFHKFPYEKMESSDWWEFFKK